MKSRLLSHPGLKAASLIVAFAVWLIIMNVNNPVVRKTIINIPLTVTNASYVESMGLAYAPMTNSDSVSVTVETNRSIAERLSQNNITATVDLTQIVDMNSNPVMVPVNVSIPGVSQNSIIVQPRNVQIRLEELVSRDFVINAVTGSSFPARGYEVGTLSCTPEKVTIRGAKSMVERIDSVQAEVDVSYLSEDSILTATLHIFDKNGDEMSESRMKYFSFNIDVDRIRVNVKLYRVQTDVGIAAETYGDPAPGYYVGEITMTPQTVSVAGTTEALMGIREQGNRLLITEESRAVDISGASEDVEIRVNLPDYLPTGTRLAAGLSDTVVVNVKILEFNTKSLVIETKNIKKENQSEKLNAVFTSTTMDVRIKGTDAALASLTPDMLDLSVDLKGLEAGTYTLPIQVGLPEEFSLAEEATADITLTETTVVNDTESVQPAWTAAG